MPDKAVFFVIQHALELLHDGERESLFLCNHLRLPLLLTDDLDARDAAKKLGITPVGSLGIVVRAFRLGELSMAQAERCLRQLHEQSSLFLTSAVVESAIE
ncbi:MAG: hypothetical protein HY321_15495 [Armatimonadetes bacterium]|nr:hypothetical protein [Armatimonadota bacterium]